MPEEQPTEPYVGPRPFDRGDESLFFGRDHEAVEVVSLILSHPVVLLYAPSGSGKTSLLKARVIPLLEEKSVEVLGPARVGGETHQEGPREAVKNVFLFNALMSIQPEAAIAGVLSGKSLAEFLGERPYPPAEDLQPVRLLLFDQFEEIFTSYPDRWPNRADFFEEIGAALEEDPRLRAAFAMREEYIASLDPYAGRLPERMRTRYRLEPLREQPALEAVKRPVAKFHRSFAEGAAEDLVDNLLHRSVKTPDGMAVASSEFVDPLQLQVVCRRLWGSLPADVTIIERDHITGYADIDKALEEYYDECIRQVVQEEGCDEAALRSWFEDKLITSEKTRSLVFRGRRETEGLLNEIVAKLEEQHLVHAEMRGGQRWYELIHDRLIEPIRASNRKWKQEMRLKDNEVERRIEYLAHHRSSARKLQKVVNRPIRALYKYAERSDSTDDEAKDDWSHAELIFALEVLEGNIHLRRLADPKSYRRLEIQWLSDVKRMKAYLLWEEHEGSPAPGHPDDYYLAACRHLQEGLVNEGLKAPLQSFNLLEEYLKTHYLDAAGRFDPGKVEAELLLKRKAHRIFDVTQERDDSTNWAHASDYARMYYGNIVSAVKVQDEESTLAVLKAFQLSRAPENRYLIINCFEAAVAIYFLSPQVVREIWARADRATGF
jgi:hypothetical protein